MKNKEKILIALASFSFLLIVYLVIASKELKMPTVEAPKEQAQKTQQTQVKKVDLAVLKTTYQNSVRNIYASLEKNTSTWLSLSDTPDPQKYLLETKDKLMGLVVPEEYRIFHLTLIKLIDGVADNNFVIDEEFQKGLNKIGQENSWLN